ncbi:MAG TPA: MauE/DoxX family redox-associated membrane protein [Geothrix sp.]|nr:MauE/DoxX family redox-associated membrane protein [Geothrix sp.]
MRRWLFHPRVTLAARLILGLVFLLAALPKIADPPGFAKAIWAYELVPAWGLNLLALGLPWLECFAALALVLGFWVRAAALWAGLMLIAFTAALTLNLARRHPVDCGCFGQAAPKTEAARLADMRWAVLRDLGLLLLVAQVLAAGRQNRSKRTPS